MKSLGFTGCLLSVWALAGPAAGAELQAYAGAVAGFANGADCGTSGPDIPGPWFGGLTLPVGGFGGCGLSGGVDNRTAASGPLSASQSVTGPAVSGTFTGTAQAHADYWSLGVAADGANSGGAATLVYRQTASFARFLVPVTLNSPGLATGTPGAVNFTFHVEGSMTSLPNAPYTQQIDTYLQLRINGALNPWTSFAATIVNDNLPFVRGGATGLPGSFVLGAGTLSGFADVTSTAGFAFQWGVPFLVEVAMSAQESTCCYGTSMGSDFLNTAYLSGIQAYGPGGLITDFSGLDGVGNALGPTGITGAVPEPASAWLLLAGGVALALLRHRRRSAGAAPELASR